MMALYMIVMLWGYAGANGACNITTCKQNRTHSKCENVTDTGYGSSSKCVPCKKDTDCKANFMCQIDEGECKEKQACDVHANCTLEMPVCATVTTSELATTTSSSAGSYGANKPTSFCTSCKDDTDCSRFQNSTGTQHVCSNGACTKCDANGQDANANNNCKFLDENAKCGEGNFRMCGKGFACQKAAADAGYGANTTESGNKEKVTGGVNKAESTNAAYTNTTSLTTVSQYDTSTTSTTTKYETRRLKTDTTFCMKKDPKVVTDFSSCTCQEGAFPTPTVDENEGKDGEEEGSNLMLIIIIAAVVAVVVLIIIVAVIMANKKKDVNGKSEVNFQPAAKDAGKHNRGRHNNNGGRRDGDERARHVKNPNHANSATRGHVALK